MRLWAKEKGLSRETEPKEGTNRRGVPPHCSPVLNHCKGHRWSLAPQVHQTAHSAQAAPLVACREKGVSTGPGRAPERCPALTPSPGNQSHGPPWGPTEPHPLHPTTPSLAHSHFALWGIRGTRDGEFMQTTGACLCFSYHEHL